jgi:hypothetical protein
MLAEQAERRAHLTPTTPPTPPAPSVDLASWKRQDYAAFEASQQAEAIQQYRAGEMTSTPPTSGIAGVLAAVLGWGNRLFGQGRRLHAATNVRVVEVDGTLRIFGPRDARGILGFRKMVNIVSPENQSLILQSTRLQLLGALRSPGTPIGLATNIAVDGARYLTGEYDNTELAAALTVDTGVTIASALLAGFAAGVFSGALVGGTFGFVVGAVPAAIIGGIIGAGASYLAVTAFNGTGARDYVVGKVADMYADWTGR